jgi:hypothetical protein
MLRDIQRQRSPDVWLGEVDRRSSAYVRWVQQSLNAIDGAGLVEDGKIGPKTRSAVQRFQRRVGLVADGVAGPKTEAALLAAGASPPPGASPSPAPVAATLAELATFSQRYVARMIADGRLIDCADLAIEIWIQFGAQAGVPVSFDIWDSTGRRWIVAHERGVRVRDTGASVRTWSTPDAFVRYVQSNLGARGLVGNTFEVAGGHRAAVAGDVYLWEYHNNATGAINQIGHTQIFDSVLRGSGGASTDEITYVQGNLPPTVPVFFTRRATYFTTPRAATIGGQPHTGVLVGNGPRRFNAFSGLR